MKHCIFYFITSILTTLIIFHTTLALASGLDYYEIESKIEKDFMINTKLTAIFNGSVDEFNIILPGNVLDLSYKSKTKMICNQIKIDKFNALHCKIEGAQDLLKGQNKTRIEVTFRRRNIKYVTNAFRYEETYKIPYNAKRLFSIIYLPMGATLAEEGNSSYYPLYGKTSTDGKHIMVYWGMNDIEKSSMLKFSITYSLPMMKQSSYNIIIALLTFFVVFVMVVFGSYMVRGKGGKHSSSIDIIMPVLTEDEKRVIEVIKEHNGEVSQKVIVRETDFSKAKVSRLVKSLKERRIIDVKPLSGRENKIVLLISI